MEVVAILIILIDRLIYCKWSILRPLPLIALLGCSRRALGELFLIYILQYCFANGTWAINISPQLFLRQAITLAHLKRQSLSKSSLFNTISHNAHVRCTVRLLPWSGQQDAAKERAARYKNLGPTWKFKPESKDPCSSITVLNHCVMLIFITC